ncbi:MAG TPA: VWA domain-containing protein [Nannocystis exedens]|nr:VWA domain-containing protein [Nannocystis exedens]
MKRSIAIFSTALLAIACNGPDQDTDTDTDSGITITTINPTTTSPSTGTNTTGTDTTGTDTSSETDPGTDSTGVECTEKSDCDDGYICQNGSCEFDPTDCGNATIEIPITTPNVVLVLDKSGSMVANSWDGDGDPNTPDVTRWFSLYSVVDFITSSFDNSMNLGMVLYPSKKAKSEYGPAACLVEATPDVPTAPNNGMTILSTMPPAAATSMTIQGGTPARAGMVSAIEHLSAIQDNLPQFLILVTDGAANCSLEAQTNEELFEVYDDLLAQTVTDAAMNGIPTFVVGIDIKDELSDDTADGNPNLTNTYEQLNALAVAGGVPKADPNEKFYNSQNQIELQDALQAIAEQVLPCVIDLDPVPKFPDFVEVTVNGVAYGKDQVMDCNTEDGWKFVDDTYQQIQLCGEACTGFQGSGNLDAQYKCPGSG